MVNKIKRNCRVGCNFHKNDKVLVFFGFTVEVIPELVINWEERYYSVSEADGSVEVCAELSTLQFTGTVEVNYATVADSAEGWSATTYGM